MKKKMSGGKGGMMMDVMTGKWSKGMSEEHGKEGMSMEGEGRKASKKAKRKNPRLKRIRG